MGKVGSELELLCVALDALRTESELEAFAREACLERVSSTGEHLRVWKGKAVGAGVEIVLIPALVPGGGMGDLGPGHLGFEGGACPATAIQGTANRLSPSQVFTAW